MLLVCVCMYWILFSTLSSPTPNTTASKALAFPYDDNDGVPRRSFVGGAKYVLRPIKYESEENGSWKDKITAPLM